MGLACGRFGDRFFSKKVKKYDVITLGHDKRRIEIKIFEFDSAIQAHDVLQS